MRCCLLLNLNGFGAVKVDFMLNAENIIQINFEFLSEGLNPQLKNPQNKTEFRGKLFLDASFKGLTSTFSCRRFMKTCWWNCPLRVSSCPSFLEPAQMWTFTTWPPWTQRCIATCFSSRATRVTWKSWALTSPWSTTIWEKLR